MATKKAVVKKKTAPRTHQVRATLSVLELTKAGTSLELEIFAKKEKIGTLQIGRGSLTWFGAGRQRGKRLSWTRFAEEMNIVAYGK